MVEVTPFEFAQESCGSACPGGSANQMPRPIRFGDVLTWTTGPQWGSQFLDWSAQASGVVNVIDKSEYYEAFPDKWHNSKKWKKRVDCPTRVAASGNRSNATLQWQIEPLDAANIGKVMHYGDATKTFRLKYLGACLGYFQVGAHKTSWPIDLATVDHAVESKTTFIDGEFIFLNPTPGNTWNRGVTENLLDGRASVEGAVFYGDLLGLSVQNADSEQKNGYVYVQREYSATGTDRVKQEPFGHGLNFPDQYCVYPFNPNQTNLRPSGTNPSWGDTTSLWHEHEYSLYFMMWPAGTIGYKDAGVPNACKCECDDPGGKYYYCRKTGEFSQCRKVKNPNAGKKEQWKWTGCEATFDCRGVMATNVCGELSAAMHAGACPGDTDFCCDQDTATWKCRSRSLATGVSFSCPAPESPVAFEAAKASGCPFGQWTCKPPGWQPILPLVPTKKKTMTDSASAQASSLIPLEASQDGVYSCETLDKPVFLCS